MTLTEAKELLIENNITFSETRFSSISEFCSYLTPYMINKDDTIQVIALIIKSDNGQKHIALEFIDQNNDGNYTFYDLYFGQYFYELFDCEEEHLSKSILDEINSIISNNVVVIVGNDLKNGKWLWDSIFDKNENDGFGLPGFEKAMQRIKKPKNFLSKLKRSKKQYEIYDWNTYQCIIK